MRRPSAESRRAGCRLAGGTVLIATLVLSACGSDGTTLRDTIFDPPSSTASPTATVPPAQTAQPSLAPASPPAAARPVTIAELSSPENATAEIVGTGGRPGDPVTVDGRAADVLSFDVDGAAFVARVWIEEEGAHTVCVLATCGRVYTRAPDAETPEEIDAQIESALEAAAEYVDVATVFPDWTIVTGRALSGTGGSTDIATKTVTIARNRGRSVDDFVRTVLHELGHVADEEWLDDDDRRRYREIRGIDPDRPWHAGDGHRLEDWAQHPSEDFAEAMVMIWTDGRWMPRTLAPVPAPTAEQLAAIRAFGG